MANALVAGSDAISGWAGFSGPVGDDPYGVYAEARREAPVRRVVLSDGRPAWIVTGYAEGRQALLDPRMVKSVRRALAARPEIVARGFAHPLFGHHKSTSASAPRWPASKATSPSPRCCRASYGCAPPSPSTRSTGSTGSPCAA